MARGCPHRVSRQTLHMDAALLKNFGNVQILRNAFTIVRAFFLVDLSNLLDFVETGVTGVLVVAEFRSCLEIWVAPFLGSLALIFARNFYKTREQLVPRALGRLHRVSRRILHMDAHFCKNFGYQHFQYRYINIPPDIDIIDIF